MTNLESAPDKLLFENGNYAIFENGDYFALSTETEVPVIVFGGYKKIHKQAIPIALKIKMSSKVYAKSEIKANIKSNVMVTNAINVKLTSSLILSLLAKLQIKSKLKLKLRESFSINGKQEYVRFNKLLQALELF